ncbi:MAG: hypothetical protein WA738_03805 [Candidatus Angelobacter sp.]
MAHFTYTLSIDGPDGPLQHTAEALRYWHDSDGAIVVEALCCGKIGALIPCPGCSGQGCTACGGTGHIKDEDTRSRHTFYDIGRDVAGVPVDPVAEVTAHVTRVAQHHAAVQRNRLTVLDGMVKHPPSASGGAS